MDVLEAANVSGVTVTINNGNWTNVPTMGNTTERVLFQIDLTAGAGTKDHVGNQGVKVTNNYDEDSIKAAVKAEINSSIKVSNEPTWQDFVDTVVDRINRVADNGKVTSSASENYVVGNNITVTYSFEYNDTVYTDSTVITLK